MIYNFDDDSYLAAGLGVEFTRHDSKRKIFLRKKILVIWYFHGVAREDGHPAVVCSLEKAIKWAATGEKSD